MRALITGGTRGIGKAIAIQLSEAGFDCCVTGTKNPEKLDPRLENVLLADFTNPKDVAKLTQWIQTEKPSVLVNNAGINIKGPTSTYSAADLDKVFDVNLKTPFLLTQSALPGMIEANWGRIINITSLWGVRGNKENAAYCATKFGLDGLTASIAPEVASNGVTVNSIAPGFIMTEAAEAAYTDADLARVQGYIPIGDLGMPNDIARFARWLASDESRYMTGQNILIDGGLTRTAFPS